jgi:hypothetical protein
MRVADTKDEVRPRESERAFCALADESVQFIQRRCLSPRFGGYRGRRLLRKLEQQRFLNGGMLRGPRERCCGGLHLRLRLDFCLPFLRALIQQRLAEELSLTLDDGFEIIEGAQGIMWEILFHDSNLRNCDINTHPCSTGVNAQAVLLPARGNENLA